MALLPDFLGEEYVPATLKSSLKIPAFFNCENLMLSMRFVFWKAEIRSRVALIVFLVSTHFFSLYFLRKFLQKCFSAYFENST